jgi:uncharacterized protein RhaS with RHS repeats
VGNIKTISDGLISQSFAFNYDYLDRLTSATASAVSGTDSGYNESYAYDVIGNITSKAGVTYSYAATGQPRPHAPTAVGSQSYSYDANGNLLSDGTRTYTWNVDNQPTQITTGSSSEAYYYSAEGERVGTNS